MLISCIYFFGTEDYMTPFPEIQSDKITWPYMFDWIMRKVSACHVFTHPLVCEKLIAWNIFHMSITYQKNSHKQITLFCSLIKKIKSRYSIHWKFLQKVRCIAVPVFKGHNNSNIYVFYGRLENLHIFLELGQ